MPAPIYLPQDPSTAGNIFNPAFRQAANFMWNVLGQAMQNRYLMQRLAQQQRYDQLQADIKFGRQKELAKYKEGLKAETKPSLVKQYDLAKKEGFKGSFLDFRKELKVPEAKLPSLIQQYEYAKNQGYKGSLLDFKKEVAKAGSTTINVNEYQKALTKEKAKEQAGARVGAQLREDSMQAVKSQYAWDWEDMEPWQQEELVFREMDRRMKETFPNKVVKFDDAKNAWVDAKTGKILRKYIK